LFILDRSIGYFLEKIYLEHKRGDFHQTTYAMTKAKEDILIFGSSRALHHYVSDTIEEKMHLSTYNLGRNGRNILYSHALFSQIVTYHKPKLVILDVTPTEFSPTSNKRFEDAMVAALLPYAHLPAIKENINNVSKSAIPISKIFKTYAYNSEIAAILGLRYGFMPGIKNFKGYVPLKGNKINVNDTNNSSRVKSKQERDTRLVKRFKDFLALAHKEGIEVFVIVSPIPKPIYNSSIPEIRKITEKYNYTFLDFSTKGKFHNYSFFYDNKHLNDIGARAFTQDLIVEIQNLDKNKVKSSFLANH
jgi:hypothetical protein